MKKTILIAAVMFFAFSVAASAQALFDVGSTPVTTVTSCGKTEMTGDITFSTVPASLPVITGTIVINYGVPVTSVAGATATVTYGVTPATPLGTGSTVLTGSSLIASANILTILIDPGAGWANGVSIVVHGVKVDVSGSPNLSNLVANISGTQNTFVAGETSVVVISSISSALNATATGTIQTINAVFGTSTGTASATVKEGYLNAWIPGIGIQFNFSALPAGLKFTFLPTIAYGTGGTFTLVNQDTAATTAPQSVFTSTSGAFSVIYQLTTQSTAAPATTIETLTVTPTVDITTPLALGTVAFSAQVANFIPAAYVPNYAAGGCPTGSATIVTILPASTALLIPYATVGGMYDTGIAIANTTTDPFAAGNTAVKQDGAITFYFYPQTGTAFRYPAAGGTLDVGTGLVSGLLPTGRLYTVLLSELLAKAGQGPDFSGYIIAVINATNGHGQYFISDFEAFTNGALMLVINPNNRAVTGVVPEMLEN
jgi:hypothetical protein